MGKNLNQKEKQGLGMNLLVLFLFAPVTFYYLKSLGRWAIYSLIPWTAIYFFTLLVIVTSDDFALKADSIYYQIMILTAFVITNICLTVKWTREWNEHLDVPENKPDVNMKSPETILKERYAKGEITKQEYDQIRQDLDK